MTTPLQRPDFTLNIGVTADHARNSASSSPSFESLDLMSVHGLDGVSGLAIDSDSKIWIVDANLEEVIRLSVDGSEIETRFDFPAGSVIADVATHSDGTLYLVDATNLVIYNVTVGGAVIQTFVPGDLSVSSFNDICFDSGDNMWIIDPGAYEVKQLSAEDLSVLQTFSMDDQVIGNPVNIAVSIDGTIWIPNNNGALTSIFHFSQNGNVIDSLDVASDGYMAIESCAIYTNGDLMIVDSSLNQLVVLDTPSVGDFRTESWQLVLDVIDQPVYGYGYGQTTTYIEPEEFLPSVLNYFAVLGFSGSNYGYGVDGSQVSSGPFSGYQFGWGYEWGPAIARHQRETITVRAYVTENGVPQEGVRVIFRALPDVILEPNVAYTDEDGYATTTASLRWDTDWNSLVGQNQYSFRTIPSKGFMSISAEIDKRSEENDGAIVATADVTHQFIDQAFATFNVGTYAFQSRYGFTYGYAGYGYIV